jgi:hypothetical protein
MIEAAHLKRDDDAPRTAVFLCAFYPHYFINMSEKWKTATECLLAILAA